MLKIIWFVWYVPVGGKALDENNYWKGNFCDKIDSGWSNAGKSHFFVNLKRHRKLGILKKDNKTTRNNFSGNKTTDVKSETYHILRKKCVLTFDLNWKKRDIFKLCMNSYVFPQELLSLECLESVVIRFKEMARWFICYFILQSHVGHPWSVRGRL